MNISPQALYILSVLIDSDYEAYIVGGAVRDLLIENNRNLSSNLYPLVSIKDYDFTTNAKPEEILKLFPEGFYENDFGTVMVTEEAIGKQMGIEQKVRNKKEETKNINRIIDISKATKIHESLTETNSAKQNPEPITNNLQLTPNYEITTYRSKELYSNFRKPDKLEWGESIEEDLERRDFTINAIALKINKDQLTKLHTNLSPANLQTDDYQLIDPFNGLKDLEAGIIRSVGDADVRFQEDALRMLRAIRFSVQLNMQISDETFAAIERNCELINHISRERIGDEILKMLKSDFPAEAIELLDQTGLLQHIIPELLEGKGVEQGGHHDTDVWTHSIDALRFCPAKDPVVRLATLLHDVGKPRTKGLNNGDITFYNHEIVGSRMAKKIARRLRLNSKQCDRIFALVRHHMFYYQRKNTDASIRRFMRKVGLENIDDILDLREADRLGSGARRTSWRLEEMKQRMIEQLHQPMDVTDLAINGHDLMQEFNLKPGPILGKILQSLLESVIENPEVNERSKLLKEAKTILSQM